MGFRFFATTGCLLGVMTLASAQVPGAPPKPLTRNVEPGLETAVKWKWQVHPSERQTWGDGRGVAEETPAPPAPAPVATATPVPGGTYEVKSGDRLVFIARKFGITVVQLKGFNNLQTDMIRIGQILNIPNREQAAAIAPFPVEKKPVVKGADPKVPDPTETLNLQIFLDREGFSTGPIDGKYTPLLDKVAALYLSAHPEFRDLAALKEKAASGAGELYGHYMLKAADFNFIVPPRAQRSEAPLVPGAPPKPKSTVAFDDLVAAPQLAYKGPWEFVAERFHCDEMFLRSINDEITTVPTIGTVFRVPRVPPFVIESSLVEPLQPVANPQNPVTVIIEDLILLEILENGKIVAVMPISPARPGLRGRGTWTILNAIPRPKLSTIQEPTASATPPPPLFGRSEAQPTPAPTPTPAPKFLASGPNNPVGIVWINLAKAGSTEPLPFGLHGTSIPDQVRQMDSLGGFRMANWNISRALRLLPEGTPMEWRAGGAPTVPPAAAPAALPAEPVAPPVSTEPVPL